MDYIYKFMVINTILYSIFILDAPVITKYIIFQFVWKFCKQIIYIIHCNINVKTLYISIWAFEMRKGVKAH